MQTDSHFPNRCYKDIKFFVKALGISRATVYKIIKDLIDKELVVRDIENSFLRTTKKFNQEIEHYDNKKTNLKGKSARKTKKYQI